MTRYLPLGECTKKLALFLAFVGALIFCAANEVHAAVYHVSTGGNDTASGSSTSPWRTLSKANGAATAGDVVIIHGGEYTDGICPARSGAPGSPIMFQAAQGEKVVLRTATGVKLGSSMRHITIEGFEIRASYRVVEIEGSSYITIRDCRMFGGRGNYSGFSLDGASYCVIRNNYYDRQDPDGSSNAGDDPTGGDGLRLIGNSHHNLIESNTVTRCEHVGFASSFSKADVYQSYNVWRNNISHNNHTNFSLQDGVVRCVFENNVGYYMGLVWTGGNGWCFQFTGTNCIIRFNTLYDDTGTVYTNRKWPGTVGTMTGSANGSTPSMLYNKIYNNTIYGETDQTGWKKDGWRFENYRTALIQNENVLKNNIIAGAGGNQVNDIDIASNLAAMNNRYEANLLYGAYGQAAMIRYEHSGGNSVWNLEGVKRSKPNQWAASNKEGNPLFVNINGQGPAKDFRLQQNSPAIDAGTHLTSASNSGNGTTLVVKDAGYFIDGWGIPGVEGDSIKIESEAPVGIRSVDYSTNTITLASPRTWAEGARVFYFKNNRFQGSAPDMGAHEYGNGSNPNALPIAPVPAFPADGSTVASNTVLLSWTSPAGCTGYRVQVGKNAAMTTVVVDQAGLSAANFTVYGLEPGTLYYWRVSAGNGLGTSAWSVVRSFTAGSDQATGRNILDNSDFDAGTSAWTFYTNGTGSLQQVSPGYDDDQAVSLLISRSGSNMQFYQHNIPLETNAEYRLSFAAHSSTGHGFDVVLQQHDSPYANYGLNRHIELSTEWALYSVDFAGTVRSGVSDGRLMFWLGSSAVTGDQYWIDRIVLEKIDSISSPPSAENVPSSFALKQNFPNPFNPSTTIKYTTPLAGRVVLRVFNILGEEVTTLVREDLPAGEHQVRFEAGHLPSGTYFYRLETPGFQETKRMLFMK